MKKKLVERVKWFIKSQKLAHGKPGLYKYGSYDEYVETQVAGNINKLSGVWVSKDNIRRLSEYIERMVPDAKFGLCHGTRQGHEQRWFKEFLGIPVLGTEISPTANKFPDTIQWDFHKVKPEWIGNVDFIYSNSLDHSYDPSACLGAWMSCLSKHGICILEWSPLHVPSSKLDPFGGTLEDYKDLISKKYSIVEILKGSRTGWRNNIRSKFIIVKNNIS